MEGVVFSLSLTSFLVLPWICLFFYRHHPFLPLVNFSFFFHRLYFTRFLEPPNSFSPRIYNGSSHYATTPPFDRFSLFHGFSRQNRSHRRKRRSLLLRETFVIELSTFFFWEGVFVVRNLPFACDCYSCVLVWISTDFSSTSYINIIPEMDRPSGGVLIVSFTQLISFIG